jgi:cellulase/cellobiase CelA1
MAYGFTAETCQAACPTYKYFALQNNGWCCCDNDLTHATKYGAANCGKAGGGWCNYVYEALPAEPTPAPVAVVDTAMWMEIGPYKDTGDRAMRYGPHAYGFTAD